MSSTERPATASSQSTFRALRLLAAAAALAPLLFFALAAAVAYQDARRTAESRIQQSTRTASEHAAKISIDPPRLVEIVGSTLGAVQQRPDPEPVS